MLKQIRTSLIATAVALLVTSTSAFASSRTVSGRVTAVSAAAFSVLAKEVVTFKIDGKTVFTKLLTQKPWEEDVRLTVTALQPGRYVAVHVRPDDSIAAAWIQVATDLRPAAGEMSALSSVGDGPQALQAPSSAASSSDLLGERELLALVQSAKSPADHLKLSKHFAAEAARYDADAEKHAAMAKAYRARPSASESKRPGTPDTAMHCDRLAELAKSSATLARDLSAEHQKMAAAAK